MSKSDFLQNGVQCKMKQAVVYVQAKKGFYLGHMHTTAFMEAHTAAPVQIC